MLRNSAGGHTRLWVAAAAVVLIATLALLYGWQEDREPEPVVQAATNPELQAAPAIGGVTQTEMRNVIFYSEDGLPIDIHYLKGKLLPTSKERTPSFDDKSSFLFEIESGEVGLSPESLTNLMNHHTFNYHGAPISDVKISIEGSQIKQKGKLKKGIPIPFEMLANIELTDEGRLRLHPAKFKVLKMPAKGLMKAFDLELDELVELKGARGVQVHENDLYLDPENLLPAPGVRGKVTAVRVANNEIIQSFGSGARGKASLHLSDAKNYMAFRGGVLRFGKLTMRDADLTLVDASPKDAFVFAIDHYNDQLVAGYSKSQPDLGLVTFVPDYNDLREEKAAGTARTRSGNGGNARVATAVSPFAIKH